MSADANCDPLPDQQARDAATERIEVSFLLRAGAGSGKTRALVDRYLYILDHDEHADVDNIVAITFTRKAAREMKERVRAELVARMATAAEDDLRVLRERIRKLETAPICTIHSLCAGLLEQYPFAAKLDPRFTLLDETQTAVQLPRVVEDSLLGGLNEGRESAATVIGRLGKLANARQVIVELLSRRSQYYDYLCSPPSAEAILQRWAEIEADDCRKRRENFVRELNERGLALEIAKAAEHAQGISGTDQLARAVLMVADRLSQGVPEDVSGQRDFGAAIREATRRLDVGRQENWGAETKARVRGALEALRDLTQTWFKHFENLAGEPAYETAELAAAIWAEAAKALEAWRNVEDAIPALDFEDVQIRLRDLLRDDAEVRHAIQARFRHILVDEFQDTDALQRDLVWLLAGLQEGGERSGRVFVVGDAKQSIYRFRNADVKVFNEACREFEKAADAEVESLSVTFRAHRKLVDFFNELFQQDDVMGTRAQRAFEVAYEPMQALRDPPCGRPAVFGMVALSEPGEGMAHARVAEARLIASVVSRLLNARPLIYDHDTKSYRPLGPGDVAILFRAATDVQIYEDELDRLDVPYYNAAGRGFYTRPEVTDLLNLMRAVANPDDAVALVGVLRSPMFALSDVTLFWLAQAPGTWWQRLMSAPERIRRGEEPFKNIPAEEHDRVRLAAQLLGEWRQVYDKVPVSCLLQWALEKTGYSAAMAALPAGERCVANLHKLLDRARDFDGAGRGGLAAFAEELTWLAEEDAKEEQAPTEEEQGDSVRLSTIHGAKGLQWPVVIVADLNRKQRSDGHTAGVRMHPDYGIIPAEVGTEPDKVWRLAGEIVKRLNDEEDAAEAKRLLYVALTRASEILIMSSGLCVDKDRNLGEPQGNTWLETLLKKACQVNLQEIGGWDPADPTVLTVDGKLCPWFIVPPKAELTLSWLEGMVRPGAAHEPEPAAAKQCQVDLGALLARVSADTSARQRFTVTEIARYLDCPRYYWLRYVEGFPDYAVREPREAAGLSALDVGNLAHHLLRMVGTGGLSELDKLLGPPVPGGRALRVLDDASVAHLRDLLSWYLEHDFYRQNIAGARLRTEAPISFPLDGVLIEGKVDAVAERDGAMVVIDYKTGIGPQQHEGMLDDEGSVDADRFQVALYAYGLSRVTGRWPRDGVIVYLRERGRLEYVHLPQEGEEAAQKAREAVAAIREQLGGPPPRKKGDCGGCRLLWACKVAQTVTIGGE